MTEDKKQSYLTLSDKKTVDNIVVLAMLFGFCAGSFLVTVDDLNYPFGNLIFFVGCGLVSLYIVNRKLKAISLFSEDQS